MLLSVENLKTYFHTEYGLARAVDDVSLRIDAGETVSLVGESGCGKSLTALSIMQLIDSQNFFFGGGKIFFEKKDLLKCDEHEMRNIRGNQIAMIFQEPMKNLNPVLTVGYQLMEPLLIHQGDEPKTEKKKTNKEARDKALELLDMVKIPHKAQMFGAYAHELSGGMRQRVMIAMAIACRPELLIADEPTTALDIKTENEILKLIQEIQKERRMAMLLITHDLGVASRVSNRVAVMYAGKIVEQAKANKIFEKAAHPYTYKLLRSLPVYAEGKYYLESIPGRVPLAHDFPSGCRFAPRCELKKDECELAPPPLLSVSAEHQAACVLCRPGKKKKTSLIQTEKRKKPSKKKSSEAYLRIKNLKVYFDIRKGILKRKVGDVKAVDDVSFEIPRGTTVALVGTSGCGKTTLGRGILQLIPPTSGEIHCDGEEVGSFDAERLKTFRHDNQIIFQDPFSSLNPKMTVGTIIAEGILGRYPGVRSKAASEIEDRIDQTMAMVGLDPVMKYRHPHEFSGGQRQRIGIARSIIAEPRFIVCDEVTSALDVSVQAQILNLLEKLQRDLSLTYLFISHDQSVVKYLADHIIEMHAGKIVDVK